MWFSRLWNPRNRVETADQADRWSIARLFTLGGDVSGAASVNGADDVFIEVTVLPDFGSDQLKAGTLRLSATADAGAGSTGHGLQIGEDSGQNVIYDTNEIMARINGAPADLHLNPDGGRVTVNNGVGGGEVYFIGGKEPASGSIVTGGVSDKGWRKCAATGVIEQWGRVTITAATSVQYFNFATVFPNGVGFVGADGRVDVSAEIGGITVTDTNSRTRIGIRNNSGGPGQIFYRAIGH